MKTETPGRPLIESRRGGTPMKSFIGGILQSVGESSGVEHYYSFGSAGNVIIAWKMIRRKLTKHTFSPLALFLLGLSPSFTLALQTTISPASDSLITQPLHVEMKASIAPAQVPLNRLATLTVRLEWRGRIDDVEFDQLDNPQLTNLKLTSSASSNWTGITDNQPAVARIYEFQLSPQSLGMGYADAMRVAYLDKATGQKNSLYTTRLGVEAIDAIPEPGEKPWGLILGSIVALAAVSAGVVWVRKKRIEKREAEALAAIKPIQLEQKFLDELKQSIDLNTGEVNAAFALLYKLTRRYIAEKYSVTAQGISTEETLQALREQSAPEDVVMPLAEVLQTCDLYKYSGESGDPTRLARAYTQIESILQRGLNDTPQSAVEKPAS
jgi:hypothetical protein